MDNDFLSKLKWREICNASQQGGIPILSLEERMKQIGTLLGEDGRRHILEEVLKEHQENPFVKDFVEYLNILAQKDSKKNLDEEEKVGNSHKNDDNDNDNGPLPKKRRKRKRRVQLTFTDRCVAWYQQQQPGVVEGAEPPANIKSFFGEEFKELLRNATEKDKRFLAREFNSNAMARAFVEFVTKITFRLKHPRTKTDGSTIDAFEKKYVNDHVIAADNKIIMNTVDDFIGHVDECHAAYKAHCDDYLAPCICLLQSSGYGKARLMHQVSQRRKLLYICVAPSSSSCYPVPNAMARDFLFQYNDDERNLQTHLEQRLEHMVAWCLQQEDDFMDMEQFGSSPADFWSDLILHDPLTMEDYKLGRRASHDDDEDEPNDGTIWIAFGGARHLLNTSGYGESQLSCLRRALAAVSQKIGHSIFAIFISANTDIASYPSSSWLDRKGSQLFRPYILLTTQDALKDAKEDFRDVWSFVGCGRPLWKALYPDPASDRNSMISFPTIKLTLSRDDITSDGTNADKLAILAIVLCRMGVYLSPQSSTATYLAANHMATLLLCDHTHTRYLVTYLSDPVLTMAGAQLWHKNDFLARLGLPVLRRNLVFGVVSERYRGELVGKMLLLIGMDKTSGNEATGYDGKWYKVSEFMKHCFGISGCLADKEAYMGFSHFIPRADEPKSYQEVKDLLHRRGACCLPPDQSEIHLLIPFWIERPGEEPLISYMLIRINNKNQPENASQMRKEMDPEICFPDDSELREPLTDIILITMEVGTRNEVPMGTQHIVEKPPSKSSRLGNAPVKKTWEPWVYSANSIAPETYPFLDGQDRLRDELALLAKGSMDLQQRLDCDKRQVLQPGMHRRHEFIRKAFRVLGTDDCKEEKK